MIQTLHGTWQLIYSSFPMWQKEGVNDVTFTYTLTERNGKKGLIDEVRYFEKKKAKSIKGFDKPDEDDLKAYIWRGEGLLMIASSRWKVEWIDPSQNVIVISFERSLFSPAGIDVLSKAKNPSDQILSAALAYIHDNILLREKAKGMIRVWQV